MIVRKLITLMGYEVDQKSERSVGISVEKVKRIAAVAAGLFTAAALTARKFVQMGSDAAETLNVMTESFEDQTDTVLDWASAQAKALGRSEFLLREYAASLGAMLRPMTGSAEAAAEMSTELAQLAVDLGSFFNVNEPEALQALQSALAGQSEPMRRFGVVMTQGALDAFALQEGLGKTVRQMSEAEKVALRYRFILNQTTKAQGDAARTAGGYANLTKALSSVLTDLGTRIGLMLLPAAERLLEVFVATARAIGGPIIRAFELVLDVVSELTETLPLLVIGISAVALAFKVMGIKAVLAWLATVAPAVLLIVLLGLIGAAILVLIQDLKKMGDEGGGVIAGLVSEFQHWLSETGSVTDAIGKILITAFEFWAVKFSKLFGEPMAKEIRARIQDFKDMIETIGDAIKLLTGGAGEFLGEQFGATALDLSRDLGELTGGLIGRTAVAPAAATAAARAGANISAPQNIEVNIQAAPGMNEEQLGQTAGAASGRGVDAANRRTRQRLAVGGATP